MDTNIVDGQKQEAKIVKLRVLCAGCHVEFFAPVCDDKRLPLVGELEGECPNCNVRLAIKTSPIKDSKTESGYMLKTDTVIVLGPEPVKEENLIVAPEDAGKVVPLNGNNTPAGRRMSNEEIEATDKAAQEAGLLKPRQNPGSSRGMFPMLLRSTDEAVDCKHLAVRSAIIPIPIVDKRGVPIVGMRPQIRVDPLYFHCASRKVIAELLAAFDKTTQDSLQTVALATVDICRLCVHHEKRTETIQ